MTLCERIKELRKVKNLTQQEFADKIGTTRNNIAGYETGRREPSAAAINLIITKLNVSETWLRTGVGEMFVQPQGREEEIQHMVENLLKGRKAEFKYRLISVLNNLDENHWEILEGYLMQMVGESENTTVLTKPDLPTKVAVLERQNQELKARIEAIEQEDEINGLGGGEAGNNVG